MFVFSFHELRLNGSIHLASWNVFVIGAVDYEDKTIKIKILILHVIYVA